MRTGCVVDVESYGKFLVTSHAFDYRPIASSPNGFFAAEMRATLAAGRFDRVETGFKFRLRIPNDELSGSGINLRVTMGPEETARTASKAAEELEDEAEARRENTLSRRTTRRVAAATVRVRASWVEAGETKRGVGSGFFVSPFGLVVTNAHVVGGTATSGGANVASIEIDVTSGKDMSTWMAEVLKLHPREDLAVLRVLVWGTAFIP